MAMNMHNISSVEKTKALVHHIVGELTKRGVWVTKTKIAKYMYLIDFGHYAIHGQSVSGVSYLKFKFGPVPVNLDTILLAMVDETKDLSKVEKRNESKYDCYVLNNPVFDINIPVTATEVAQKTFEHFKAYSSRKLSIETHYHYSWITTPNGKKIPYETAKFIDFPWLGYSKDDKSHEDFQETEESRKIFSNSPRLHSAMRQIQGLKVKKA